MKAVILNCTLKKSPSTSNTEALAKVMGDALKEKGVDVEYVRMVDHSVLPGVSADEGPGDEWPPIRDKIKDADIVVLASPTWVGQISSEALRVIERLDAFFSEKDKNGQTPAFGKAAGFVVTGNSDGAKSVMETMMYPFIEIGFTVPGQAFTYFNQGSAAGPTYTESDDETRQKSISMAKSAAAVLFSAAEALAAHPYPALPSA